MSKCGNNPKCENGHCVNKDPGNLCGNGHLDGEEKCDSSNLNGKSCRDFGEFIDGTLACNSLCDFDTSGCVECTENDMTKCGSNPKCEGGRCVNRIAEAICGNGILEEDEACETGVPLEETCEGLGVYVTGLLACDFADCSLIETQCFECTDENTSLCAPGEICKEHVCFKPEEVCGNGILEGSESCDKKDGTLELNGKTCQSWPDQYVDGVLDCNRSCEFNKSGCVKCTEDDDLSLCAQGEICRDGNCVEPDHQITCGDGLVETGEACEEGEFNGQTCADLVPERPAGKLKCDSCSINTDGCLECANDSHCAGRLDGKTTCLDNTCTEPPIVAIPKVVISQIYPGGGITDSIYNTKYVELLNLDESEADISGWSIQYASATGSSISRSNICVLPPNTKLPRGGYYLVALQDGSTGADIPNANHSCSAINPSSKSGKFFLVDSSEALGSVKPKSGFVDAVGYGSANWGEGEQTMAILNAKLAGLRKERGCVDTDNNANDFLTGMPAPHNVSSAVNLCDGSPEIAVCNNKVLEETENCDGSLFKDGKTACGEWNTSYNTGSVSCNNCSINYSACSYVAPVKCGNNALDTDEDCDGSLFRDDKTACGDWNASFNTGTVSCNNCSIDYAECSYVAPVVCGNNILDTDEDCDDSLFRDDKTDCGDWNSSFNTGTVSCNHCKIDYSDCSYVPPNSCENNGDVICSEKDLSLKKCVNHTWELEKCPNDKPYCKTGAEGCSALKQNEACNPETFVPFTNGGQKYSCSIYVNGKAYVDIDNCGGDCLTAKYGIGVGIADARECSKRGEVTLLTTNSSPFTGGTWKSCFQCKPDQDGVLHYLNVPASYTYDSSGNLKSCVPETDDIYVEKDPCENDDVICSEKDSSLKRCVNHNWVLEHCFDDTPYCKTGAEGCSELIQNEACNPETFVPFTDGSYKYSCSVYVKGQAFVDVDSCNGDCMTAKYGIGVGLASARECSERGEIKLLTTNSNPYTGGTWESCFQCKPNQDGVLHYLNVPASYIYDSSGNPKSCVPESNDVYVENNPCKNGDVICSEKDFSLKRCVNHNWVLEHCLEDTPYCKTGAEGCSELIQNEACNPETFVPFTDGNYKYSCSIYVKGRAYVDLTSCNGDCMTAKQGAGVAIGNARECSERGEIRLLTTNSNPYTGGTWESCFQCKPNQDGELHYLNVPASYTYDSSGNPKSCVPWPE